MLRVMIYQRRRRRNKRKNKTTNVYFYLTIEIDLVLRSFLVAFGCFLIIRRTVSSIDFSLALYLSLSLLSSELFCYGKNNDKINEINSCLYRNIKLIKKVHFLFCLDRTNTQKIVFTCEPSRIFIYKSNHTAKLIIIIIKKKIESVCL